MHGLVMLDERGDVLRPAILWNDQRTAAQCDTIRARLGKQRLIQITGNDALTGFTAPKILWVQENEPDVYARCRHILLPKDYIRFRLTGEYATDRAGGAGTILFDLKTRTWSPEVLQALGIPAEWLPPTHEGPQITGVVNAAAAAATGLKVGTPVVGGGGDQAAGSVGVGAVQPGIVALTLGTSGVVFATTESALVEPEGRLHAFCHAVPGRWHFMGVMLSAAGSLQWYRDTLAPQTSFDDLVGEAASVPAGSEGLFFLPYLTGERTPHPDPLARGAWIGLTVRHTRAHRREPCWKAWPSDQGQLHADPAGWPGIDQPGAHLWRRREESPVAADHGGRGRGRAGDGQYHRGRGLWRALLAGVGGGFFSSVPEACEATIQITGRTAPSGNVERYAAIYPRYRALYPASKTSSRPSRRSRRRLSRPPASSARSTRGARRLMRSSVDSRGIPPPRILIRALRTYAE
jgi:xylulokinase